MGGVFSCFLCIVNRPLSCFWKEHSTCLRIPRSTFCSQVWPLSKGEVKLLVEATARPELDVRKGAESFQTRRWPEQRRSTRFAWVQMRTGLVVNSGEHLMTSCLSRVLANGLLTWTLLGFRAWTKWRANTHTELRGLVPSL